MCMYCVMYWYARHMCVFSSAFPFPYSAFLPIVMLWPFSLSQFVRCPAWVECQELHFGLIDSFWMSLFVEDVARLDIHQPFNIVCARSAISFNKYTNKWSFRSCEVFGTRIILWNEFGAAHTLIRCYYYYSSFVSIFFCCGCCSCPTKNSEYVRERGTQWQDTTRVSVYRLNGFEITSWMSAFHLFNERALTAERKQKYIFKSRRRAHTPPD